MQDSKIEWTNDTFNPWVGCTKVSDGCKNCYAERLMDHRFGRVTWGPHGTRERTETWGDPVRWDRLAGAQGVRRRVFCASLADVFEDRRELAGWRRELMELVASTPNLDWLMLTKRPENAAAMMAEAGLAATPPNVWLGTSVEDQPAADERIPHLVRVPAVVHFVSAEPLLGPVVPDLRGVEWVIAGGESGGPGVRPMHPDWVRSLRDRCVGAGVAFHFKQWGHHDAHGRPVGKHAAGRVLDGRTWDGLPTPASVPAAH